MGVWSSIFGSGDVIKHGFDLIDKLHTSDQEMVEAKVKGKVDLLNAYAAFKIAQRVLAFVFCANFIAAFWIVLLMRLTGHGNTEDVTIVLSEFYIGEIMLTIIVFYFGGGFLEGAVKSKKGK